MYRKNIISALFLKARHERTLALLGDSALRSALDVGCDDGEFLARIAERFPDARLSGCEIDENALMHARKACPSANLIKADFMDAEFPQTELVALLEILEHAKNPKAMLGKAARIAGKGGLVLVSIPRHEAVHWRIIWAAWSNTFGRRWKGQHNDFTESEAIGTASACGLELVRKERFFFDCISLMLFRGRA
jgi:trans-aconitate methyltransferase